jgi:hypothetical protein
VSRRTRRRRPRPRPPPPTRRRSPAAAHPPPRAGDLEDFLQNYVEADEEGEQRAKYMVQLVRRRT